MNTNIHDGQLKLRKRIEKVDAIVDEINDLLAYVLEQGISYREELAELAKIRPNEWRDENEPHT